MKSHRSALLLAGALAASLLPHALAAQEPPDTFRLDDLVVSAHKTPVPRAATTASLTVLSGDALRRRGLRTVAEAMRLTPGAAVVQIGSQGAITSVFLRGGESDYVQVLVDGVRVNNPGGVYDWANLTLDNVERIEIVRGPASVLYGSDAVTGVVQIFTRTGAERTLRLRLGGGLGARVVPDTLPERHYATSALNAELSGRSRAVSFAAGLGRSGSDGLYAFNNGYGNTTASLRLGVTPGGPSHLDWTARYTRAEFHYPTDGNGRLVDRNQFRNTELFTTGLDWSIQLARQFRLVLRSGLNHNLERYSDAPDGPADTVGTFSARSRGRLRRSFIDAAAHFQPVAEGVFSLGAEIEQQEDVNRYDSDGSFGPFSSEFGKERTNRAVYVQAVHAQGRLALNGGLRLDANDRFGDFFTYRTGAAFRVLPSTRLRLAAGTAFKEPTFFENYAEGFTRGNPELEPEHSRMFELGVEQTLPGGRGSVQLTHFRQRFRDLIQYVSRDFGSTDPNYENVTAARALGTELEWELAVSSALGLSGSITLLETEAAEADVEDPTFAPGQPLLRRPERMATMGAAYTRGRATLDARWYYVGERADLDFATFPATRVSLDAYHRLDLNMIVQLRALRSNALDLTLRLENVLDAEYEEVLNYPARGRSIWLGVESRLPW
jgi:vitamin B12 transporter